MVGRRLWWCSFFCWPSFKWYPEFGASSAMIFGTWWHDRCWMPGGSQVRILENLLNVQTWEGNRLAGGFKYFYFHPYLGKISILTNIFQLGWNHQLPHLHQPNSILQISHQCGKGNWVSTSGTICPMKIAQCYLSCFVSGLSCNLFSGWVQCLASACSIETFETLSNDLSPLFSKVEPCPVGIRWSMP